MCLIYGRREAAVWAPCIAWFWGCRALSEEEELLTKSFSQTNVHNWFLLSYTESVCPSIHVCEGWALWLQQQSDRQQHLTSFLFLGSEERVAVIAVYNSEPVPLDSLCFIPTFLHPFFPAGSFWTKHKHLLEISCVVFVFCSAWYNAERYNCVILWLMPSCTRIQEQGHHSQSENPL